MNALGVPGLVYVRTAMDQVIWVTAVPVIHVVGAMALVYVRAAKVKAGFGIIINACLTKT